MFFACAHERCTVLFVPAKTELRLKTTAFDELAEQRWGGIPQREIGEHMGVSEATWSLARSGRRPVPRTFLVRFIEFWPRHNIADFTELVPTEGFDS